MKTGTLTRTQQDRMPWPIGVYWLRAQQARGADDVYRAAEGVVRCVSALVLADVLDATWSDDLTVLLRGGPEKRALEKPGFGTRIALLRALVKAHDGHASAVLTSMQDWWRAVDGPRGPLQALVEARNRTAHGAGTAGDAQATQTRREAVGLLAAVLRPATFLRDVQVVHPEGTVRTQRGKQVGAIRRLNGPAPYLALAPDADWPLGFALEDNRVYMGTPDGRRWKLLPFVHLEPGDAGSGGHPRPTVLDTIDRRGRMRFLEPITGRDDVQATLPNAAWEPVDWFAFLEGRTTTVAAWALEMDSPHTAFRFESPAEISDGLRAGTVLEGMRLVQKLGEGGAAAVWEVEDVDDGSVHALKVLKPEMTENEVEAKRFEQEVATMKRLYRSGCRRVIGPIEAFRTTEGEVRRLVVRMPLMTSTLKDAAAELRAANGGQPPSDTQLRDWLRQGLEALTELHAQKVVHRDIKPSNFLVDGDGRLFVSDLGVARDNGRKEALTRTGDIVGTDIYMAPEQRVGSRDIGPAADVYALAVSIDELLHGSPRPMAGKGVDGPFGALLRAMGHMDADERPTAAAALAQLDVIEGAPAAPPATPAPAIVPPPPTSAAASETPATPSVSAPARSPLPVIACAVVVVAAAAAWFATRAPDPAVEAKVEPTAAPVAPQPVTSLPAPVPAPAPSTPTPVKSAASAPVAAKPKASTPAVTPSATAVATSPAPAPVPAAPSVKDVPGASVIVAVRPKVTPSDYPASATQLNVSQGRCTVAFTVDATGVPSDASVRDCTPGFEGTFAAWAKRHRFAPPAGISGAFRFEMDLVMRAPK